MHKYKCFLSQCFSTLLVYEVTKLINNVANVSFLFSSCVIQSLKTSLKHSPSPEALFSLPDKKKKKKDTIKNLFQGLHLDKAITKSHFGSTP